MAPTKAKKATATKRTTTAKKVTKAPVSSKTKASARPRITASQAKATRPVVTPDPGLRPASTQAQDAAERAVLIPVGAALVAADRVRAIVAEVRSEYADFDRAQKHFESEIKRFERRGYTARNRLEREIKKTRTRFERDLRQRRKSVTAQVDIAVAQGSKVASRAAERVASLV
ncbi:MAG: hypothetical protein WCK06_03205 [Actinomycetota bacterium]